MNQMKKNQAGQHRSVDIEAMLRTLPQEADKALGGLTATPFMKAKIDRAVQEQQQGRIRFAMPRWVPALCCCALVLIVGLAALPRMQSQQPGTLITSGTLGEATEAPAGALTADLRDGNVFITAGRSNPGYRSIWSEVKSGSFPLIGVNGRYYRLLTSPISVDRSLLGNAVGAVSEYTTEPSLSGTDTVLSNVVSAGTKVYAVKGMDGTLVAAEVNGSLRLFQRVSFNGNALRGKEKLADTLQISGHVIAMELSGVGTITDPAVCEKLLTTLLKYASYESSGSISSKQALLIELDNGLVVQMAVRSDMLAACGVWSCPEFFEAFEDACN